MYNKSHFFSDGSRRIDFVLVHEEEEKEHDKEADGESGFGLFESDEDVEIRKQRQKFLHGLVALGALEIEERKIEGSKFVCTLVHLPPQTAFKMAQKVKLLLPLAVEDEDEMDSNTDYFNVSQRVADFFEKAFSQPLPVEIVDTFDAPFDMRHMDRFLNYDDPDEFLTSANRSFLVYKVLESIEFGKRSDGEVGIDRMVNDGIFTAAFPLHTGPCQPADPSNLRSVLLYYWGAPKRFWRTQPLDHIKTYFGANVAFYFLWLGFYTRMLIILAFFGVVLFVYSLITLPFDDQIDYVCNSKSLMCPICEKCEPYPMSDNCIYAYISHIADNNAIVVYALFVSVWALLFCKLWRRTQATYACRWDVYDMYVDEANIRPQYAALATGTWTNPVTKEKEPHFPDWLKTVRTVSAFSILLLMVLAVITFIVMCIFYRLFIANVFNEMAFIQPTMVASTTAAIINLIFIMICNLIYDRLSIILTDWEMHRTEYEYDTSLTLKSFIFQFVNYYSSIVYIGFFKGKFSGTPTTHREVLGSRPEQCLGSCFVELALQLTIIMIGNQLINNFMEVFTPIGLKIWNKMSAGYKKEKKEGMKVYDAVKESLFQPDFGGLFSEYLEMVIQFGFCTIFVIALPLAPLFALMNNIAEIRIDANKLIKQVRRPVIKIVKNIGAWQDIIEMIAILAVIANSCLIAFTSEFIPRWLYYSKYDTLSNFYARTLREIEIPPEYLAYSDDFEVGDNVTCFYKHDVYASKVTDEMNGYDWEVLFYRISFVALFEHLMLIVAFIVEWGIGDIPKSLSLKLQRRRFLQNSHMKED